MSFWSIVFDIFLSILASFVFWLFTFVVTHTNIIFSTKIEKSLVEKHDDGDPLYRVKIMNIGTRDLMEISYVAKIAINDRGHIRTSYLSLGDDQTVPILKGKDRKKKTVYSTYMPGFYVSSVAKHEFSKAIYPERIQDEAKNDRLTLDDLLREYGENLSITLFVTGNDRLTGARKTFVSKSYTAADIIEGRFRKWEGMPKGIKSIICKKKIATELISRIDTVKDMLEETYIDPIEVLNNTSPSAKEGFLADTSLRKPKNEYGNIHSEEIRGKLKRLNTFIQDLQLADHLSAEDKAEILLLKHNLLALLFVEANYEYNHCRTWEKYKIGEKHQELNEKLYGLPKEQIFYGILEEKLPDRISRGRENPEQFKPKEETISKFFAIINEYLKGFFSYIPKDKETFSIKEACSIINNILKDELGATALGWQAVVDPNASVASVLQKNRLVKLPGKRSKGDYTLQDLRAIIAHEIGVHVNRALPANRAGSFALSIGLPYYEPFEEGLAVAVEQAVNNQYFHPGIRHYLSLGFAKYEHLDFRGVFERQLEVFGNDEITQKTVFDSVQRAFRGTGELLNCKDLVYYNGSDLVWGYIEQHIDDPELIQNLFEMGKIDSTREEHCYLAEQILGR